MSSVASYMQANTAHEPDPRFENVPDDFIVGQQQADQQQQQQNGKKFRLKLSQRLHYTAIIAFGSYLILLIAFASPYWLSSYRFSDSAFKRLGLWDFCFDDYRHPSYQYDIKFTGCHWIYSSVYTNIRDWLQPPWFMFVQATLTMGLCVSSLGLMAISLVFMHYLIQYQLIILCASLVCHMFATLLISFGVIIFYARAFDRSWIMYPNFNHVDWSFFFALTAAFGNGTASYLYYKEVQLLKERLLKMKRLIVATNGRSIGGGDQDSLDAVYAGRSVTSYNQQQQHQHQQPQDPQRPTSKLPDPMLYPYFTQV